MARAISHSQSDPHPIERRFTVIHGSGGGPPADAGQRPISNAQLGLLVFIAFETMIFVGLVTAYYVLRSAQLAWPPPDMPRLPLAVTAVNTVMLLCSAVAMRFAARAAHAGSAAGVRSSLAATAILGVGFLAIQGSEWVRLIHQGLTLSSGSYGSIFYSLIGLHAVHVVGAVVWLVAVFSIVRRQDLSVERRPYVALCATYWYFVCALWLVIFGVVYLD